MSLADRFPFLRGASHGRNLESEEVSHSPVAENSAESSDLNQNGGHSLPSLSSVDNSETTTAGRQSSVIVNAISYPRRLRRDISARIPSSCRRGWYWKSRERNLLAAMFSLLSVALIGAALADQQ